MSEPTVLTVEEAAKVLRIGRSAAYAAAKSGDLPTIRIGHVLRVPRHRLAALLGEPLNEPNPAGEPGSDAATTTAGGRDVAPA